MWTVKVSTLISTKSNHLKQDFLIIKSKIPPLGSRTGILNSPRLLIPLINTRKEKMKSWTHFVSSILEQNQEQKDAVLADLKEDFLFNSTTPHPSTIKALQNTKIKIKALCLSPHQFLTQSTQYQS